MIYNAKLVSKQIIENTEENEKKFKVYSLESTPKNIWNNSPLSIRDLNEEMKKSNQIIGVGYIISWPNLTKVCTFLKESVNEKTCFHPPKAKSQPFIRYPEMETGGCLAEEIIGGEEAQIWLESEDLNDYFSKWSNALDKGIILEKRKLQSKF